MSRCAVCLWGWRRGRGVAARSGSMAGCEWAAGAAGGRRAEGRGRSASSELRERGGTRPLTRSAARRAARARPAWAPRGSSTACPRRALPSKTLQQPATPSTLEAPLTAGARGVAGRPGLTLTARLGKSLRRGGPTGRAGPHGGLLCVFWRE